MQTAAAVAAVAVVAAAVVARGDAKDGAEELLEVQKVCGNEKENQNHKDPNHLMRKTC